MEAGPFKFADKLKAAVSELSYLEEKLSLFRKLKKKNPIFYVHWACQSLEAKTQLLVPRDPKQGGLMLMRSILGASIQSPDLSLLHVQAHELFLLWFLS